MKLSFGSDGKVIDTNTIRDREYMDALQIGIAKLIETGKLKVKESREKGVFSADYGED